MLEVVKAATSNNPVSAIERRMGGELDHGTAVLVRCRETGPRSTAQGIGALVSTVPHGSWKAGGSHEVGVVVFRVGSRPSWSRVAGRR